MQELIKAHRELVENEDLVLPGLQSCQGCGAALAMKLALAALGPRTILAMPASCWGVIIGGYPYSALKIPVVHLPFATAAVAASGIRAGLDARGEKDVEVVAWAGDGGTYDIGLQALSGAAERNADILFVCYDNEAYMNTGIQRSSATPMGAWTTTTPSGALKQEPKKDMEKIMLSHYVPYVATASVSFPDDLVAKFKKAKTIRGTRFIRILAPCPPGWRIDSAKAVKVTRMATQCGIFPLYEVVDGKTRVTVRPRVKVPVRDYLAAQGRFSEMTDGMMESVQSWTDVRLKDLEEAEARS